MDKHPIENIMTTTMENIRDMVDVNTVIGDPVVAAEGSTIIPISRVSFGFVAGGGEYGAKPEMAGTPFAGGTGAGVTVQPMGFLSITGNQVRLTPVQYAAPIDRVIDMIPGMVKDVKAFLEGQGKG
ncbi:MAG: GerW family sporulation protein [Clostridia bacterium]|nr:GerW family sporulation protein [Clostridia bacterium]